MTALVTKIILTDFFNSLPIKNTPDADFFEQLATHLRLIKEGYPDLLRLSPEIKTDLLEHLQGLWLAKNYDMTLFHYAAYLGNLEAVKAIRDLGFNSLLPDNKGCTALHYAAFSGNCDLMRLLISQHGLDPDTLDDNGEGLDAWARKGAHQAAIDFCADKANLALLKEQYLSQINQITSNLKSANPPLLPDLLPIIAQYLAPLDEDHTRARYLEKLQKIRNQHEKIEQFYQYQLRACIAWAMVGACILALGIALVLLSPLVTLLPAAMICFAGVANVIYPLYLIYSKRNSHWEGRFRPALGSLESLKESVSILERKNQEKFSQLKCNIRFDADFSYYQGRALLLLGLLILIVSLIVATSPIMIGLGAASAFMGLSAMGLSQFGLYKKRSAEKIVHKAYEAELSAIPSY